MNKKIKELSIYGGTSLGWLEDAEEVEKEEQLAIQAKAKEYAEWRTEQLPIKAYTDLSQSKTLSKILPLESADMCYSNDGTAIKIDANPYTVRYSMWKDCVVEIIPCWSLASLLAVASTYCSRLEITLRADKKYNVFAAKGDFVFRSFDDHPDGFDNLVDVYYEMVLKLHELNLL